MQDWKDPQIVARCSSISATDFPRLPNGNTVAATRLLLALVSSTVRFIMSLIGQAQMYWRFTSGLRSFLKEPITVEQSRRMIRHGLDNTDGNLLTTLKGAVHANMNSFLCCQFRSAHSTPGLDNMPPGMRARGTGWKWRSVTSDW